jgi:DNA-binding NtrC family response regulator
MTSHLDSTIRDRQDDRPTTSAPRLVAVVVGGAPVEPRVLRLPRGTTELGRSIDSPLGLSVDARVSRVHARVVVNEAAEVTLENQSPSGTEVNGAKVASAIALREGDTVLLGESVLVLRVGSDPLDATSHFPSVLGFAPAIRAIRRAASSVARSELTVLLLGESGSGKEVIARALHDASGRSGPFVAVNCAAIPATLAESQLFGHVAGAFTGAQKPSPGVFRAAQGGTLFLDEIAELPLELQPKLLRVLEDRQVAAVGSVSTTPVDTRVLAATNRDVVDEVRAGRFRGDLYARLAEYTLALPPLRDRREDILLLLTHQYGAPLPPMRFELLRALVLHPWPFNVRELRTIAAQLRILSEDARGEPLGLETVREQLETSARLRGELPSESEPEPEISSPRAPPPTRDVLEALLREHDGNVADVARLVGRSRKQVYRWVATFGIDLSRYRADG